MEAGMVEECWVLEREVAQSRGVVGEVNGCG